MVDNDDARPGLLLHGFGTGAEQVAGVFRSALNAAAAMPGTAIEIVIQGPAVTGLAVDGVLSGPVGKVLERGVTVRACENSMHSAALDRDSLLPGVTPVPSAVVHLAQRQWNNWAYVRL